MSEMKIVIETGGERLVLERLTGMKTSTGSAIDLTWEDGDGIALLSMGEADALGHALFDLVTADLREKLAALELQLAQAEARAAQTLQ